MRVGVPSIVRQCAKDTFILKNNNNNKQNTYFDYLNVGTCTSSNDLQGLDSNLNRAVTPDLLVRLNVTAAQLSYVGAIGSSGGLLVPLLTAFFDK